MSLQTHVALTYIGNDQRQQPTHPPAICEREVGGHSESVGRLRRRLAQMQPAPAASAS